jgi:SAM-dependent methyltransferase
MEHNFILTHRIEQMRTSTALSRTAEDLRRGLRKFVKPMVPSKYHPDLFRFYLRLVSRLYGGNECSCPCCGGNYRKFVPYMIGRINPVCPGCGSFARHRLLFLYLKNRTNIFSDRLRVLHFAPEYWMQNLLRAKPNLDYVSTDLDSPLAMEKADIMNLRYADCSFDVILCSHVLEHVCDDRAALRELFRVLRPGGWAILQVPLDNSREVTFEDPNIVTAQDRELYYWQADHVRLYGRDFKQRVEQAGFQVKQDPYISELGFETVQRFGLSAGEDIYYCSKPIKPT